jgi:hypothetical protein
LRRQRENAEQLLGEERVSVGSSMDLVDERSCREVAEDRAQLRSLLTAVEPVYVEPLDATVSLQLGQPRHERVPPVELVGAERRDQDQSLVVQIPDEEGQEVAGRPIRPVDVLDDKHNRLTFAEALEQREDRVEGPSLEPLRP